MVHRSLRLPSLLFLCALAISFPVSAATAVQFTLPSSLSLTWTSPACSGNQVVTCTKGTLYASSGTLDSGSTAVLSVTARATKPGSFTATASASTTSPEGNTVNNSGSATIVVNAVAPSRRRAARH